MAYEFNGSNQSLSSIDPIDAVPLTIACWIKSDVLAVKNLIFLSDNNANANGWGMYLSAAGSLRGFVVAAGVSSDFGTTSSYSINTWHHACLSCPSNSERTVYLDAGGQRTNTATRNVIAAGVTALRIGFLVNALDGLAAEVGVWSAALTQPEIASLARGMTCDKIRPQSLVFYAPLVRDLIDQKGGLTITNNNGATVAQHPRVYA
jgi:hypothetical protein